MDLTAEAIEKIKGLALTQTPVVTVPDGTQFIMYPEGSKLHPVQPLEPRLKSYIEQTVTLETREAFAAYVNGYKTELTRLFMDTGQTAFTAIFDYHRPPADSDPKEGEPDPKYGLPSRGAHKAVYACPVSDQWIAWSAVDGKETPQDVFADFLEERAGDVMTPDSADLLEVAKRLQVNRKVAFQSHVNLGNGNVEFGYTEEDNTTAGKQRITVPTEIELGIPVFRGEDPYKVRCFFRYRLKDAKLSFIVKMVDRQLVLQDALKHIPAAIASDTGLEILAGNLGIPAGKPPWIRRRPRHQKARDTPSPAPWP